MNEMSFLPLCFLPKKALKTNDAWEHKRRVREWLKKGTQDWWQCISLISPVLSTSQQYPEERKHTIKQLQIIMQPSDLCPSIFISKTNFPKQNGFKIVEIVIASGNNTNQPWKPVKCSAIWSFGCTKSRLDATCWGISEWCHWEMFGIHERKR